MCFATKPGLLVDFFTLDENRANCIERASTTSLDVDQVIYYGAIEISLQLITSTYIFWKRDAGCL